jgi:hypothetical protein
MDVQNAQDSERDTAAAYRYLDSGAAQAMVRGAYCADRQILVRHTAAGVDAGIQCSP